MITVNDIWSRGRKLVSTTSSANALLTGPVRIFEIAISARAVDQTGRANAYDALTQTGDPIRITHAIGGSASYDFGPVGILFATGVSVALGGSTRADITYLPEG